jgi:hypothetical protein
VVQEILDLVGRLDALLATGGVPETEAGGTVAVAPGGHVPDRFQVEVVAGHRGAVHVEIVGRAEFGVEGGVDRAEVQLDPDLGPVLLDHAEGIGRGDTCGGVHVQQDQVQCLAVLSLARPLALALQAQAIQQAVGRIEVELDVVLARPLHVVVGVLRRQGLADAAESSEEGRVHVVTVDREGQGGTEVGLEEQLAQRFVLVGQIHAQGQQGGVVLPPQHRVVVLLLVLDVQLRGVVPQRVALEVQVPIGCAEVQGILGEDLDLDGIDERQLPTVRVGLPEVRVALELRGTALGVRGAGDLIGTEHRAFGVGPPVVAVPEVLVPGVETRLLGGLLDLVLVRVVRVELLEVVLGLDELVADGRVAHVLLEQGERVLEVDDDRELVRGLDGGASVPVTEPERSGGDRGLVSQVVVDREDQVLRGEGLAVGPLQTFTQDEGELRVGVVLLESGGERGNRAVGLPVPFEQGRARECGQGTRVVHVELGVGEGAAVGSGAVLQFDDHRLLREAIREGGQISRGDPVLEDRRLGGRRALLERVRGLLVRAGGQSHGREPCQACATQNRASGQG